LEGIEWKRYKTKFVFSAEGFGERFRDHIAEHAGLANVYRDTLNHYGTVDLGTMAYETPLATHMRRTALKDKRLYGALFAEPSRLPTLAQYLPEHFYFESIEAHGIACTADGGLPLIRYDLNDHGGVTPFPDAWDAFEAATDGADRALATAKIADTVFKLPFVHVYERDDFSVVLYGANIYPEHVRLALESKPCAAYLTGKCTLRITETRKAEPKLEIHAELKKGARPPSDFSRVVVDAVVKSLLEHNSEYRSNYGSVPRKVTPKVILWPFGDEKYFSGRGKQKWIDKKKA
jgi:phenylacetate-CoA ligase